MNIFKYLYYLLHPNKVVIRRFSKGLGDNLMLTYLSRAVRHTYPQKKIIIETDRPELFEHNPTIDYVVKGKKFPFYCKPKYRIDSDTVVHVLKQLLSDMPLRLNAPPQKLEISLKKSELEQIRADLPDHYIVTCPVGKRSFSANRKEWRFKRFQETVDRLNGIKVVQVGTPEDPLLKGAHDFRTLAYPIRICAAVLKQAQAAIFLEGGMMHLANAVGTPAVVIYGGALSPETTGYASNVNLTTHPTCSPCFTSHQPMDICDSMECMHEIQPENVAAALKMLFARK